MLLSVSATAHGTLKEEVFEAENMGAGWGRDGRSGSVMITLVIIIVHRQPRSRHVLGLAYHRLLCDRGFDRCA